MIRESIRCLVICASAAGLARVFAQQSAPSVSDPGSIPYVNRSVGFEIRIPGGWDYDQTGFFGPAGSLGLLHGGTLSGRAALQILLFQDVDAESFPAWIDAFQEQLATIPGSEKISVKGDQAGELPAAFIVVDSTNNVDRVQTLYYAVQFDDATVWLLSYAVAYSKAAGRDAGPATADKSDVKIPEPFVRMVRTLRVFYSPELAAQIEEAKRRGRDYLNRYKLQENARKLRLDDQPRLYLIEVSGKPVGYLRRVLGRERHSLDDPRFKTRGKEGLRIREQSWRFSEDGSAQVSTVELFSSIDGASDLIEITTAYTPPPDAKIQRPFTTRDSCVREADALISVYKTSKDFADPDPRAPIKLDQSFLGLAWVRVLPALLGSQQRPLYAFTTYDMETRTIITHSIRALGPERLPVSDAGAAKDTYAYETREGLSEQTGRIVTDQHGNMLRFEAGDLVLSLSDEATIDRQFGPQRDAVKRKIERN